MDPELNQPGGLPQGTPSQPSDAEYQNIAGQLHGDHKKEEAAKPAVVASKVEPSKLQKFWDGVKKVASPEGLKAGARGVVAAGSEMGKTLTETAAATGVNTDMHMEGDGFIAKWNNEAVDFLDKPFTDAEIEAGIGRKQDGVLGFVESAAQFTTGVLVTKKVMAPLKLLAAAPKAASLLKGGIAFAVAFDPYEKRLSSMIANGPSYISQPLAALTALAPDENDAPLVARLKAGMEGIVTELAIDKLVAGVKLVAAMRKAGGDHTAPAVQDAIAKMNGIKHDPAVHGPVTVEPTTNGKFAISAPSEEAKRLHTLAPDGPAGVQIEPAANGAKVVKIVSRGADGKPNGILTLTKTGENTADVFVVNVAPEARRQGIATAMYDAAEQSGLKIRSGQSGLSAEGKAFVEARTGKPAPVSDLQREADSILYDTAAEAEGTAASMNQAIMNGRTAISVLSDGQVQQLREAGNRLLTETGWSPTDFNFSYSATSQESKATIQAITEVLPRPKVVQTHAETVAMAEDLIDGKTGDEVVQMLRDKNVAAADMPQYIQAARTYLYSLGEKITKLGRAADAQPDNAIAFGELRKAMQHLVSVHDDAAGLSRTAGRALEAHKIVIGAESQVDDAVKAGATQEAAVGAADVLAKMGKEDMLGLARLIRMSEGDPNAILQLMRAQGEIAAARTGSQSLMARAIDKANGWRAEAMLSGPKTHIVNFISNSMTALQMPSEMWWGGVISRNKGMRQQGADQFIGVFMEIKDAIRAGAKSFRTGTNVLDEAGSMARDAGINAMNPISGLSQVAHLPSRMLMSSDEFFKTLNYRASVRAQSLRLARSEGMIDPKELATRLAEDMKAAFTSTGSALNPKALDFARTATFQNPLQYGLGKAMQSLVQEHPAMRLIMPFVRTPVNLFRYAWQRTPVLGMVQKQMRDDLMAGGERAALAYAKQSMGVVVWSGAAMLAYNQTITGGGPKDPELKRQWLAAGNVPYSVKVPGGGWVSYARLNPALTAVGIVADIVQMSGELHPGDFEEKAASVVASIVSNATNQTFMQGVTDFLDAASSGRGHMIQKQWSNIAGSFVPNILRQMNPDDTLRETRGTVDELMARVPGLSTMLEPRRNILGEPIMKPPGYLNQALNPFTFMSGHSDSTVQQQMVDLGKAMSMPSEMQGKIKLSDRDTYDNGTHQSPYDRMLELQSKGFNGTTLREKLTEKMKSQQWKDAGDGTEAYPGGKRYIIAAKIISEYQDKALKQVQDEYPKLKDAMKQGVKDKRNAVKAPRGPQFISQ